jgi:chromosomal replication initiation ATPase DnaA
MLLHSIVGPTSFQDLKLVDGTICETYRESCQKRGLLENDNHWEKTMEEASESRMPNSLRHLFCIILTSCSISKPSALWEKFKHNLYEDVLYQLKEKCSDLSNNTLSLRAEQKALNLIEDICLSTCGKHLSHLGMPSANTSVETLIPAMLIKEKHYDKAKLEDTITSKEPMLSPEQKLIYEEILKCIQAKEEGIFFIDAPGGTGKTFLLNLLLAKVRKDGHIALAVASSGFCCVN